MTYKTRIAVEMLRRVGIVLGVVAVYLGMVGVIALGIWWGFEADPKDAVGFGMTIPIIVCFVGFLGFMLYESSKDKVDTLDRSIMRGLGRMDDR